MKRISRSVAFETRWIRYSDTRTLYISESEEVFNREKLSSPFPLRAIWIANSAAVFNFIFIGNSIEGFSTCRGNLQISLTLVRGAKRIAKIADMPCENLKFFLDFEQIDCKLIRQFTNL